MAKPTIKFYGVPFEVNGNTGHRPQLEAQDGVFDLDFCKEVVTMKRLAMSPEELLHAMEMVGEVGPSLVASDGRPRGITKLLKYNRYAKGNLESFTGAWNDTCKAYVKPQLMSEAEKLIDATFVNINSGDGVRLNYVAWLGAQAVTNVVKVGSQFAAYGNHMEWITGDTAKLIVGTQSYDLTCTESDVAHAVFNWPAGLNPEAGTVATFLMNSRGGIAEGQVYTSKKLVTIIAADPILAPTITNIYPEGSTGATDRISPESGLCVAGVNFAGATSVKFKHYSDGSTSQYTRVIDADEMTLTDTLVTISGEWWIQYQAGVDQTKPVTLEITTAGGVTSRIATYA